MAELIGGANKKKLIMACKVFDKRKVPIDFLNTFFPRELEILMKIDNPNIIQVCNNIIRNSYSLKEVYPLKKIMRECNKT